MPSTTEVKFYKSTSSLGGPITGTEIVSATFDNLFGTVPQTEQAAGEDYYMCMYVKNTNAAEDMNNFSFWLDTDSPPPDTTVKWGFDNTNLATGYRWSPYFTGTGSNTDETADAAQYDLSTFTLAAWFKTSTLPSPDEGFIVNKGGTGSDVAGENLNYGVWMTNTGTIRGGFETGAGVDNLVTSPLTYHNGIWHFALIYYSGTVVNLYVDDMTTPVATLATTSTPETNAKPIRIGENSRAAGGWWPTGGNIDEVRIWDRAMTDSAERTALYQNNVVNSTGLVLEKNFGTDDSALVAQTIANVYIEPAGITWIAAGSEPATPNVGKFKHGTSFPVWVWWHVDAGAISRKDDRAIFAFSFFIPGGTTPDPGSGGGGGTLQLDTFGIRKIYPTKSGGRVYESNWHLPTTTSHQWDATGGQVPAANLDPQDSFADLISPTTCRAIVDAGADTLTADTNSDRNSWRYYIKDPLDDETSSTWKWAESVEVTVYYKAGVSYSGGSIHVHCRLMGPTEHWNAITDDNPSACPAAGHEYSYEIKENGVNEFRKEEFHKSVADGEGYAENIIFPDTNAPHDTWIGMKLVTQKKSATSMKIEAWKDLTDGVGGGTWVKAGEMVDDGTNWKIVDAAGISSYAGIPSGSGNCTKVSPIDAALTMTGSAVGIRCDNTKVTFKKFSCREIDPDDPGSGGGTGGGGTGGGNPPPPNPDWKMAFVGDEGCGSTTNQIINLCDTYDYTVSVGDHAYAAASCWTSAFAKLKPNFNGAYGNHEYSESGGVAPYKTFFNHSLTYFSFNFQNVHVVVCDTNINMDPGSAQHNFVTADLNTASANSSIDWIFAVMHHPWFGSSSSHSYNNGNAVQAFHSLFMSHKVALVLTGHNHNFQRTHQVAYNASSPTNPTVFDSTSPFVKTSSGLIHVVTGTGGHDTGGSLYALGSQPSFQGYQNRTHNGIYEVLASNGGKTLTCSFVDKDGTSKFDTITITAT